MIANLAIGTVIIGIFGLLGILFYAISDDEKEIKKELKTK